MTWLTERFQIRCHADYTRTANSCSFAWMMCLWGDLNLTRLDPSINPQFRSGHQSYFSVQSCWVKSQISFWPNASHSNAMCSRDSGTLHVWQVPFISEFFIWLQKSPTLNVLCIHFQNNSRVSRWKVVDWIDFHIIASEGVYLESSATVHLIRSRFIKVALWWGLGRNFCITL
jgi:hypothetical protein